MSETDRRLVEGLSRPGNQWFDPVLFFINGISNPKDEPLLFDFRLPGLTGRWESDFDLDSLFDSLSSHVTDRQTLRQILSALAENGGVTKETWKELSELIGTVELEGTTCLARESGEYLITGKATISTLQQWLALLIAELIHRGFDDRVRVCELPTCTNFLVNWKTRGPEQLYCSKNHGSQHRVQRKRKRDQERGF